MILSETVSEADHGCLAVADGSSWSESGCDRTFGFELTVQQFYDLCHLLDTIKPPSENHMIVFNGDFVDRCVVRTLNVQIPDVTEEAGPSRWL